jgi:hypothetical protein
MSAALVTILLMAANPSCGCGAAIDAGEERHSHHDGWLSHLHYYKRLYRGYYDRHPFDYRFQFDYPWHAGPSQANWPIPPLPAVDSTPWYEFQADKTKPAMPRTSVTIRR